MVSGLLIISASSRTGIGWRTIVGIMLIGFKTERINLPSFIMDREGRSYLPFSRSGLPRMILARNRKLPFLLPPSPLPLNTAVCPTLVKKLSWKSCRSKGWNFSRQKEKFRFSVLRYVKLATIESNRQISRSSSFVTEVTIR